MTDAVAEQRAMKMDPAVTGAQVAAPDRRYPPDDPREVFGWIAYDWANSAYVTTVATVLLGPYLTALAQGAAGSENGVVLQLGPLAVTAKSFYPYCVSTSVFLQVFLLPVLGAIADYTRFKKRMMAFFTFLGAGATTLLFFISQPVFVLGGLLFIVANLSFGSAIVLYNAYLNEVASPERRDSVSSRGFAWGYMGGALMLVLNLAMVTFYARLGITRAMAVRLSLASAGLWWAGFSLITFRRLRARGAARNLAPGQHWLTVGFSEVGETLRELRRLPHTLQYLVGYLLYNDGIQTVISIASVFLAQELFVSRGLPADETFLIGLILMVQFVAFFGALGFARIAAALGAKRAILVALVGWLGVVAYSYALLQTVTQAWVLAAVIALVLGGSQALSRSLFSRMIPAGREASFFGLYEISERGTSWIGPLIFGAVVGATNSYREAMLSLVVLFVAGLVVLALTDVGRAEREATGVVPSPPSPRRE